MTRDEALAIVARLDELVREFGYTNPSAAAEFRGLIFRLRSCPLALDGYWLEKMSKAEQSAADGFSVRKFENRPGGLQGVQTRASSAIQTLGDLVRQRWPST